MSRPLVTVVNVEPSKWCISVSELMTAEELAEMDFYGWCSDARKHAINLYISQEHLERINHIKSSLNEITGCDITNESEKFRYLLQKYKSREVPGHRDDGLSLDVLNHFALRSFTEFNDDINNRLLLTASFIEIATTHLTIPKVLLDDCVADCIVDQNELVGRMEYLINEFEPEMVDAVLMGDNMCLDTEPRSDDPRINAFISLISGQVPKKYHSNEWIYFINVKNAVSVDEHNIVVELIMKKPQCYDFWMRPDEYDTYQFKQIFKVFDKVAEMCLCGDVLSSTMRLGVSPDATIGLCRCLGIDI